MCGRKTLTRDIQSIIEELLIREWEDPDQFTPSYNIAPTQFSPVLIYENGSRIVKNMKWGLIPSWAKDKTIGSKLINARSETILEKPSFQSLISQNRCVIITDGYYEWKKSVKNKERQPIYIYKKKVGLLNIAGLWSEWVSSTGEKLFTYTVITTTPKKTIEHIHNRMPVILQPEGLDTWINSNKSQIHEALDLLIPFKGELNYHPVSTIVNSPQNNSPACISPFNQNSTLDIF
ncbi:MAG: hypothetical protein CMG74_08640 [Candidatus Marinimicrobia bacterium]|nr:hypothetical protein [Candidatus Neomarinimicrobiota bacterium]|tara:strand:+ start:753 stop:1454 length:702 start_codon:yes stop_codon:yes gene_type:complete